jgi:hypothetical protein
MEVPSILASYDTASTTAVKFSNGRLLALPINIIPGWKWIEVPNALAYYDMYDMASTSAIKVSNDRLLPLPINIRQGWKWMEVTNTLAYLTMTSTSAVKVSNDRLLALPKYPTKVEVNGSAKHTSLLQYGIK